MVHFQCVNCVVKTWACVNMGFSRLNTTVNSGFNAIMFVKVMVI